jgi:hypothetical protein
MPDERFWVCDRCHSLNDLRHRRCYRCRAERSKASTSDIGEGPALPRDPAMFTAVTVGLITAVLAIYLWTVFEPGISLYRARFAGVVGAIIAIGVVLGGRGRVSLGIVIVSLVVTLATVVTGEYLIASDELLPPAPDERIPIAKPAAVIDHVVDRLTQDPLRPFIWLAAIVESVAVPWAALVGRPVESRGSFRRRRKLGDDDDD